MSPEQILLADQIAEAAALRKGVWAEHFIEAGTMTAARAGELRQQWQEAATAVRHGIATLRDLDPIPSGGAEGGIAELERARARATAMPAPTPAGPLLLERSADPFQPEPEEGKDR